MSRLGFIGTGHLACFFVEGLNRASAAYEITVSPRNAAKAAELFRNFGVKVAADNQAVVDQSDVVIVSVLPQDAATVLTPLKFRSDQVAVSVMAGVNHSAFTTLTAPAAAVISMMPGMANVFNVGPSVLFPENKVAAELLSKLGPVHTYATEAEFTTASVMGAFSGMSVLMIKDAAAWFAVNGIDEGDARRLVAEILRGNAHTVLTSDLTIDAIARGVVTPGGITELGRKTLDNGGSWADALDAVLKRVKLSPS